MMSSAAYHAITWLVSREALVSSMRRFLIGLALVLLLIASIGVGVVVARWPTLVQIWQTGRYWMS
jgi:hypothetical protein